MNICYLLLVIRYLSLSAVHAVEIQFEA